MVVASGAESPTIQEQQSWTSDLTDDEAAADVVYKRSGIKELQVPSHEDVETNDKERLEQNWRNEVKIADAYVLFEAEPIVMLSDIESMWDGRMRRDDDVNHGTESFSANAKPIHSGSFSPEDSKVELLQSLSVNNTAIALRNTGKANNS